MINSIIEACLRNRFLVIAFFLMVVGGGIYALQHTPVDAIPDIGENQVIVYTDWMGRSPQDVEDQVTYPLTVGLEGIPGVKVIRSNSMFGFSMINIIFDEGVDFYWARTRVLERLNWAQKELPLDVVPVLGPDATALGQILWYTVEGEGYDLGELRSIQDWYIRYQLNAVPGVSEVASVGGFVKQYQIDVDPNKLLAHNVRLSRVIMAVRQSNLDVGAKVFEEGGMEFIIRGLGFIESVEDVEDIVVGSHDGVPVYVKNIATVQLGPDFRRGALDKEGAEVTGGVVVMRYGENPLEVIKRVKEKITEIERGLPPGVRIVPFYDRTELIGRATSTLRTALIIELVVTALVIFLFLGHFISSLIVVLILPVGVLIAFLIMYGLRIPSNIMSLGGIAISIGVMVDAGIVVTENVFRHLASVRDKESRLGTAIMAAKEVGPAIFFSMLIIIMAFANVYFLRGQSGKLFRPLAFTQNFAMAAAAILSISLLPVVSTLLLRGKLRMPEENLLTRFLWGTYRPVLKWSLSHKKTVISIAFVFLLVSTVPVFLLESEFMPPLNEGDLLFMPVLLPGASLAKVMEVMKKQDLIIRSIPEVEMVVGKLGRAETPTDPAPVSMIETIIKLKPRKSWRSGMTREKLLREMDSKLRMTGVSNIWTQPIRNRIDMLATGIQTPIGVKVFGPDLKKIEEIAVEIENVVKEIPGALNPYAERVGNKPYLEIDIDRQRAARYGVKVGDVSQIIMTAIGGMNISTTVEGRERYPVRVRYLRETRDNVEALNRILVPTPMGAQVPLAQVADLRKIPGPAKIATENGYPYVRVFIDVDTDKRGLVDFVNEAQRVVKEKIKLPPGYFISWSGQYEYEIQTRKRLMVILPLTIFVICMLLYVKFRSFPIALLVIFALPFAFIGAIWLQFILGYKFSTAVSVGYIALFGVAVEAGVVMVDFLIIHFRKGMNIAETVTKAALLRVRPIMMTSATTILALFPIMFSTGTGAEVMKPIAAPAVGGLVTATLLNLIIVPVLFAWLKEWEERRSFK